MKPKTILRIILLGYWELYVTNYWLWNKFNAIGQKGRHIGFIVVKWKIKKRPV